ncbi:MAG: hypothetical protein KIT31_29510 [Deltaproteobacteria bacterium]|nr:hypothetical protein [Deltaproteobacteria bacterium]
MTRAAIAIATAVAAALVGAATVPAAADPLYAPEASDVVEAAYRANGLARNPVRGLVRRARLGGLVPWLTVRTGRNTRWQDPLSASQPATDVGHGITLEVRATWRLDRLVFDGREMQLAALDTARRRERRRLAARVIRTYFAWKRAVTGTAVPSGGDPDDATPRIRAARAEEAAAELDALTDGWFSAQLSTSPDRPKSGQREP